jgi:hypothetical protein
MKTLVTHRSPDLDAVTSMWLIVRTMHGWEDPKYEFVAAGKTLNEMSPDEDKNIIHVDTGLGLIDHHQLSERTSATRIVLDYVKENGFIRKSNLEPLERIADVVTIYDNFGEAHFPDPTNDIYSFMLNDIINGLKVINQDDEKTVLETFHLLDAIVLILKNKISAEEEMKKGMTFETKYGKSLILETKNDETMKQALKMGYSFVARKDPDKGFMRIKTTPAPEYDLTPLYEKIVKKDKKGTWFLHSSKNMLLNGTYKNTDMVATPLTLAQLIDILKELK